MEDKQTKLAVFRRLAEIVSDEDAILASNTSYIPIVELGTAAGSRADHVLGCTSSIRCRSSRSWR